MDFEAHSEILSRILWKKTWRGLLIKADVSAANDNIKSKKSKHKKYKRAEIRWPTPEAVAQRCSVKKVSLEISQNSQENTCARVSLQMKLQASGLQLD